MRRTVVLGEWLDRPVGDDLAVAVEADRLGFDEVWIGEMAKLDAPAMAVAVASSTTRIVPCIGPLAVTVRSPVQIALAVSTAAATTGRRVNLALGTSSDVVARWHDVTRDGASARLQRTLAEVRTLFAGEKVNGFRLREPVDATITVAAFGPRAVAAAADADRMVLNMVSASTAADLAAQHPNTAVWLAVAIDPSAAEKRWMTRGYVGYLPAPGYGEMLAAAGFGELVEFARTRPHPRDLATRIPDELLDVVALVGDEATVLARIAEYEAAGITEIGLVLPPLDTPTGRRTIEALAPA